MCTLRALGFSTGLLFQNWGIGSLFFCASFLFPHFLVVLLKKKETNFLFLFSSSFVRTGVIKFSPYCAAQYEVAKNTWTKFSLYFFSELGTNRCGSAPIDYLGSKLYCLLADNEPHKKNRVDRFLDQGAGSKHIIIDRKVGFRFSQC